MKLLPKSRALLAVFALTATAAIAQTNPPQNLPADPCPAASQNKTQSQTPAKPPAPNPPRAPAPAPQKKQDPIPDPRQTLPPARRRHNQALRRRAVSVPRRT